MEEAFTNKAYTFVQELEEEDVNIVGALACKKQTQVKVSTRYISSKLLINAKISMASFIYNCIDTFCYPNEETSKLFTHHKVIKILPYLLMTNTNLASLEFIVVAEDSCSCGECEMRDILMQTFLENDIHTRLDLSREFFEQYRKQNESVRKQVGLYEFKNIEQGITCVICINLKEYFELYRIDICASRILTMEEAEEGTRRFSKKQKQTQFQNKKGNMVMVTIYKSEFGQLDNKRYILPQ